MDAVGRALMERDDPSVFRIQDVDFDFEVEGTSLMELGNSAWRTASEFYGGQPFKIRGLRVRLMDGVYFASVTAELENYR